MATRTPPAPKGAFMHDFKDDQVTILANFPVDIEVVYRFLVIPPNKVTTLTLGNSTNTTGQAEIAVVVKREDGTGKPFTTKLNVSGDKTSGGNSVRGTGEIPTEAGAYLAGFKVVKGTPYNQCSIAIKHGPGKPAKPAGRR